MEGNFLKVQVFTMYMFSTIKSEHVKICTHQIIAMSPHQYFKHVLAQPSLRGPLLTVIVPVTIKSANDEMIKPEHIVAH